MKANINNTATDTLYENMTDTLKVYLDSGASLCRQAEELIKSIFATLIEKGLCKHFPDGFNGEYYGYRLKGFSTEFELYAGVTHVLYYPEYEQVAVTYDGEEDDLCRADIEYLPAEVLADVASALYNSI